jgi:hypothetical protein
MDGDCKAVMPPTAAKNTYCNMGNRQGSCHHNWHLYIRMENMHIFMLHPCRFMFRTYTANNNDRRNTLITEGQCLHITMACSHCVSAKQL